MFQGYKSFVPGFSVGNKKWGDAMRKNSHYLDIIMQEKLYSNKGNLQMLMDSIFGDINLEGKRVLDIGGGDGLCSFYAAYKGADKVICLEPEAEGSSHGANDRFKLLSNLFKQNSVSLDLTPFQSFDSHGEKFDVILANNSINHLDENACINLLNDLKCRNVYSEIFSRMWNIANQGAKVIICDCSRHNFFPLIGLPNPFIPEIEWHKHQAPETWSDLLGEAGFVNPKIRWSSFNSLRRTGRILLGNRLMAYFLMSHFCITAEKP